MDELIPIIGMIFVLGPLATLAVSYTPLGRALVERLRGGEHRLDDGLLQLEDEIDRLREQIASQDQRFEELHDRLDFTERLLSSKSTVHDDAEEVATPV